MRKNLAVMTLAFVFVLNLGSPAAPNPERQMFKMESSLFDKLEDRLVTDLSLETERKCRACSPVWDKA